MKKLLAFVLVIFTFTLVACGTTEKKPQEKKIESAEQKEESSKEVANNKEEENREIELNEGTADLIGYFGTKESYAATENEDEYGGYLKADFEGFHLQNMFFLADFKPNEEYKADFEDKETVRAIIVLTHAENTTDKEVDYNGDLRIVTDTKEQVYTDSGFLSENPIVQTYHGKVEEDGYFLIPLKDNSDPKKISVALEGPYEVINGAVDPENGQLGKEVKFDLDRYDN